MTKAARVTVGAFCLVILFGTGAFAQYANTSLLPANQLDNLVAPIALYPDSLLGQVLVAATYPQEITDAAQWLQQNPGLQGEELMEAARQQNWDPSVQALVAFPDVLNRLSSNIQWTTDLGNAFLAQQADVMNAVQQMRARARTRGRLVSNSQEIVREENQGDQRVIDIQPADPQVVYVPDYDPVYVWGEPAWGYYPSLFYPRYGFGFGGGISIGFFFGGLGWGGWGWGPNWFGCSIWENPYFFHHYGYRGFNAFSGFGGRAVWTHDPAHRLGVPYTTQALATRFHGTTVGGRPLGGQTLASPRSGFSRSVGGGAVSRLSPQASSNQRRSDLGRSNSGSTARGTRPYAQGGGSYATPRTAPSVRPYGNNSGGYRSFQGSENRGSSAATPRYRSTPNYGSSYTRGGGSTYHPTPQYRSAPTNSGGHSSSRSFDGGGSSYTRGGGSTYHATPQYRSAPAYSGGHQSSHPAYSGGGFRGNANHGGGGSHSSGGSRSGSGSHNGGGSERRKQ